MILGLYWIELRVAGIILGVTRSMLRAVGTMLGATGIYWEQLQLH